MLLLTNENHTGTSSEALRLRNLRSKPPLP